MAAVAGRVDARGEVVVAGAKKQERFERYVCTACGGIYFAPVNGVCPGCKGQMEQKEVEYDASGVAHVPTD